MAALLMVRCAVQRRHISAPHTPGPPGANFVWVPVTDDNATDMFAYEISNSSAFRARGIPRTDGPHRLPVLRPVGDIAVGDKLIICWHWHAKNTHVIGWKTATVSPPETDAPDVPAGKLSW